MSDPTTVTGAQVRAAYDVEVLFVGGPYDGQIRRIKSGPAVFFPTMGPELAVGKITVDIRKTAWVFPGRLDHQIFRAAVWPGLDERDVKKTALAAWACGWCLPDSASEFWGCWWKEVIP